MSILPKEFGVCRWCTRIEEFEILVDNNGLCERCSIERTEVLVDNRTVEGEEDRQEESSDSPHNFKEGE